MQNNIHAVIFDFDNVLVLRLDGTGSEEVKDNAWPQVFGAKWETLKPVFSEIVQRFSGGRGSRFDIAQSALKHLGVPEQEIIPEAERMCRHFNKIVQAGIVEIGVSPEVRGVLEKIAGRLPLFINSATPTAAMHETLEKLGIAHFFREVYGQEGGKTESIRRAMTAIGTVHPEHVLFVGDSPTDYEAAQTVGCQFIGVATGRNGWGMGRQSFPVISGVHELEQFI